MARRDRVRVMVVDDHAEARHLARLLLAEHADLEVVAEADGAPSALEALAAGPDVALVDARMPGTDGFELAPQLLERAPALRIGLLSALVDEDVRARAARAGIHRCFSKEDYGALADLVRDLAGGEA